MRYTGEPLPEILSWVGYVRRCDARELAIMWKAQAPSPERDITLCEIWARMQAGTWDNTPLPDDLLAAVMAMSAGVATDVTNQV